MTGMERIHKLAAELNEAMQTEFPDGTQISIGIYSGERINITVTEWDKNTEEKNEKRHRRELWDQWFRDGEWKQDRSRDQNEYYEKIGVLLKKEVKIA